MIPLLTRIEQTLATCTDPSKRAELIAERGCYLARVGDFAEANRIAASLRENFGHGRDARVSVWIMLLEGLLLYFDTLNIESRDRIIRAHKVSRAMNMERLRPLTAAWLAHVELDMSNFAGMAAAASEALASGANAHDVHLRVAMVLADANLYCGDRANSQHWYERAHHHAVLEGDQAALGALMYNRAAFGLAYLRVRVALNGKQPTDAEMDLLAEMDSAWSFQIGTGVASLAQLVHVSRARIAMMKQDYATAGEVLMRVLSDKVLIDERRNHCSIVADLVLCMAMLGKFCEASSLIEKIDEEYAVKLDFDDQVVYFSSAVHALDIMGLAQSESAERFRGRLQIAAKKYTDEVSVLRSHLSLFSASSAC